MYEQYDYLSDEELTRIANGEPSESVIGARQTQGADTTRGSLTVDDLTDEELERIANGEPSKGVFEQARQRMMAAQTSAQTATPTVGLAGQTAPTASIAPVQTAQTASAIPSAPQPLTPSEQRAVESGIVNENTNPFTEGVKTFFGSLWGQGRKDAMDDYRLATQSGTAFGGEGGAVGKAAGAALGYGSDVTNVLVGGLVKGGGKIAEAAGNVLAGPQRSSWWDGLKNGARAFNAGVDEYMPTDMTDTEQKFDENGNPIKRSWGKRIADIGKNVAGTIGEFAPAAIPGFGPWYANALIVSGGVNRYNEIVDKALSNGVKLGDARKIGAAAGAIDTFANAFLMGKFRKAGKVDHFGDNLWKHFFSKEMLKATGKTGATMGALGGSQDIAEQKAEAAKFIDLGRTGNVVVDQAIEGAIFHVMNDVVHAPFTWSKVKKQRAAIAQRIADEKAALLEQAAAGAATEADRNATLAEAERIRTEQAEAQAKAEQEQRDIEGARRVLESPEGIAKFLHDNPDLSVDIISARRRGENVDMGALLGENGIAKELRPAFQDQEDANAFGDRLLRYHADAAARKAAHDERANGIAEAFDEAEAQEAANDGRWTKRAKDAHARNEIERERVNAEAERLDAERAAEQDAQAEREGAAYDGIPTYEEWLGGRADTKVTRWVYGDFRKKAIAARLGVPKSTPTAEKPVAAETTETPKVETTEQTATETAVQAAPTAEGPVKPTTAPAAPTSPQFDAKAIMGAFQNGGNETPSALKRMVSALKGHDKISGLAAEEELRNEIRGGKVYTDAEIGEVIAGLNEAQANAVRRFVKQMEEASRGGSDGGNGEPPTAPQGNGEPPKSVSPAPSAPTTPAESPRTPVESSAPQGNNESPKAPAAPTEAELRAQREQARAKEKSEAVNAAYGAWRHWHKKKNTQLMFQTFRNSNDANVAYYAWLSQRDPSGHNNIRPNSLNRKEFDALVKYGKVDGETGRIIDTSKREVSASLTDGKYVITGEDAEVVGGVLNIPVRNVGGVNTVTISQGNAQKVVDRAAKSSIIDLKLDGVSPSAPKERKYGKGPNAGYGYNDFADETGDEMARSYLQRGLFRMPKGLREYRSALKRWKNKDADKRGPKPTMKAFGVIDPMADWVDGFLDGTSAGDVKFLFGLNERKGANDDGAGLINDPVLKNEFEKLQEERGTPAALEEMARRVFDARERYRKWSEQKHAEERDRKAKMKLELKLEEERERNNSDDSYWENTLDERMAAKDGVDEEWDAVSGEIAEGVAGFGEADVGYLVPFKKSNLEKTRNGDIIHFDHDQFDFTRVDYDPETGTLTLEGNHDGKIRKFVVGDDGLAKELNNGRNEEVGVQNRDGDANGEGAGNGGSGEGSQNTLESATPEQSADAAFRAWAVGRDGKPLAFATKEDEARSRALFDDLVKRGKVDGKTGKWVEAKTETVAKPEPAPSAGPKTETAKAAQSEEAPAPSAPSTIPQDLRDRGVAAIRKLGSHAADSEAELIAYRKNLVRAKRTDMVQAVDDLLEYKRAANGIKPQEGGASGGDVLFSRDTRGREMYEEATDQEIEKANRASGTAFGRVAKAISDVFRGDGKDARARADRLEGLDGREAAASELRGIVDAANADVPASERVEWVGNVAQYLDNTQSLPIANGMKRLGGEESEVVRRSDGKIVKAMWINDRSGFSLPQAINKTVAYNALFGDRSPMKCIGFGEWNGKLYALFEQPFAEGGRVADGDASVVKYLKSIDPSFREIKGSGGTAYESDRFFVSDLYARNMIRGKNGETNVIDANVFFKNTPEGIAAKERFMRGATVGEATRDDPGIVAKIAERLGKLIPGAKVEIGELSDEAKASGATAQYDRKTGTARIAPDASVMDVVHELGGHAVRQLAEKYCPQLLKNAVRYAMEAPREIKEEVYRNYADKKADGSYVFDGDALLDEIFANRFAREHGDLFRQMLNEKPKVRHWWANITNAVRSVFQDAAKRNGVDLEGLRGLGAEEYIAKVAEQLAAGKELNEWTAYGKDKGYFKKGVAVGEGEGTRNSISRRPVTEEDDKAYADAVKRGDKDAALKMVREAAAKAMPNTKVVGEDGLPMVVFRGTLKKENVPQKSLEAGSGIFLTNNEDVAGQFTFEREYGELITSKYNKETDEWEDLEGGPIESCFINVAKAKIISGRDAQIATDDTAVQSRVIKEAFSQGHDCVILENVKEGVDDPQVGTSYIVKNPSQVKSADITYDAGKLIPLSQRFNPQNPDIRYSRRDRDAATPYDERTEDGRKFNEKYGNARIGDANVSQRAVDALGDGGRELDAALAARREDAGEAKGGVLRYSRGDIGNLADVDENIRKHEKMRFGDGETRKHGMESFAVVRDGDSVYKYRTAKTGLENERTNVARHNELFGDKTPYEIADFASGDGGDVLVVKQPYIDLMPKSGSMARKQLEADLRKRFGKVEVMDGGNEMRAGGWVIDDLKNANIGIDRKTGRYAVVDALIHRADEIGGEDGAAKPKGLVVDAGMGETIGDEDGIRYSLRADNDRRLADLIQFKPNGIGISQKEIEDGYAKARTRSGILATRAEEVLRNDEGGRLGLGTGYAEEARRARELAGVQGEGERIEGGLEGVLRRIAEPIGKWRVDPGLALRNTLGTFPDGDAVKSGAESVVFYDKASGRVVKLRNLDSDEGVRLPHIPQYADDFNFFFGDTSPISISAFGVKTYGKHKGMPQEVLSQKYAEFREGSWEEALEKVHADLARRFPGMVWLGNEIAQIGNKRISDLHSDNLGIDKATGKPFVRDCNIDSDGDDSWRTPRSDTGIRYSRSRHPAPTPASSALMEDPDTSAMTLKERVKFVKDRAKKAYMRNYADRYYDVKDVVRDVMISSGMSKEAAEDFVTNSPLSPYHQKRVQSGKAEKDLVRVRAIENDMAEDIKKSLAPLGLDIDDLGTWGYASHAKARNAQKLKDHGVTDGSGISDAEADSILNGGTFTVGGKSKRYTAAQRTAMEDARKKVVHRLNKEFGLDYLHKAGLIDEASMRRLESAYGENWVSFMDDISEDGVDYGASTSVANPLKKAHGRTTALEDNPIVSTLVGAMSNVVNAKKNMVVETFARFVEQHPEMGEVRTMTPMDKMDSSRIVFRRNVIDPKTGEEKNVKMLITLYGKRGAEVAKSFTDANLIRGPQAVQNFVRQWASFATQLSPTFSLRNLMKDTVEVTMDTLGTQGVGAAGRFLRGQIAMMPLWNREFRNVLKEWRKTGQVTGTSQLAQDFKKFVESGALISGLGREGYGDVHGNLSDVTDIRSLSDIKKLSDLRNEKHVKVLSKVWNWYTERVGAMNESIEMLTRFNNFRNRLAAGESVGEAAINSREGSTDFGMYGNQRWMNSVWMFSSSILGGTMRAAKTLTGGKYGRRLAVGMIALGFLEEMANAALNDDDENAKNGDPTEKDVNEYTRENSLRLRIGDKMVKIPAHFGPFSVLKYAGNNAYRALTGQITAEEAAKNVGAAAVKMGSHLTGTGEHGIAKDDPSLIASLMPTAGVQPLVQAALNEDYKGDPIAKEHSLGAAKYAPDWKYARSNTGKGWIEMSRWLNNLPLTGGSDHEKGALDIAPEKLKYLTKQIFKNFGTDVYNAAVGAPASVWNTVTGDEKFDLDSVPMVRDVVKDASDVSQRYYAMSEEHKKEHQAFNAMKGEERREYLSEHPTAGYKLDKREKAIKRLQALARGEILNKDGKKIGEREITQAQKDNYEAMARKLMADYLRVIRK